jgi:hypothetical protein
LLEITNEWPGENLVMALERDKLFLGECNKHNNLTIKPILKFSTRRLYTGQCIPKSLKRMKDKYLIHLDNVKFDKYNFFIFEYNYYIRLPKIRYKEIDKRHISLLKYFRGHLIFIFKVLSQSKSKFLIY